MNWHITDTANLEQYSDKILEMYEDSYKNIGLIDFGCWNGLKDYLNCSSYLLEDDTNGEIKGAILYWLSDYGNKISLVISATPEIGKEFVIPKLIELLQTSGFYAELSDALEYLVIKSGLNNITDKEKIKTLIPHLTDQDIFDEDDNRRVEFPLNKKNNIPSPAGSYMRDIKDIGRHRKALYGMPCLNKAFDKNGCDRKCISSGGKRKSRRNNKNKQTRKRKSKNNRRKNTRRR